MPKQFSNGMLLIMKCESFYRERRQTETHTHTQIEQLLTSTLLLSTPEDSCTQLESAGDEKLGRSSGWQMGLSDECACSVY